MKKQLAICDHISSATVYSRIVIDIIHILHQLEFFAIRAGYKHLIVLSDKRLYQFLTEAVDIIIIVCKKSD